MKNAKPVLDGASLRRRQRAPLATSAGSNAAVAAASLIGKCIEEAERHPGLLFEATRRGGAAAH